LIQNSSRLKATFTSAVDVIWIEELDYIAKSKDKDLFYGFLELLDSYQGAALVIATTSKLADLDKTVRRGGRLDLDLRMDMPTEQDRLQILRAHLNKGSLNGVSDLALKEIAQQASGFVGSDLAQIVRNAQLGMIQVSKSVIDRQMLEAAVLEAKPLSI